MSSRTRQLKPRWLPVVAWAAFLVTVPSALWRVAMITGLLPGTEALRRYELQPNPDGLLSFDSAGYVYVFGLSLVQLGTGFLVTGLARPWGERISGRRIPITPPVVAGLLGGVAVTYLFDVSLVSALAAGTRPDRGLVGGSALAVMIACYLPIFAWGPLTIAATVGYWWRRTRSDRRSTSGSDPAVDPAGDQSADAAFFSSR